MPDNRLLHTVFVSHAHADNELCDRYVAALRDRGLDVWYDRTNMQDGRSLTTEIEAELRRRTAFVLMATPASLASQWVRSEVTAFRYLAATDKDNNRLFVPVRIADCEMPLLMVDIKWIDAIALGFDAATEALTVALGVPAQPGQPVRAPEQSTTLVSASSPVVGITDLFGDKVEGEDLERILTRGIDLLYRDETEKALAFFDLYLSYDDTNAAVWQFKGFAHHWLYSDEEAIDAYDHALAHDPENEAEVWMDKGDALRALDRDEEALTAYDYAVQLDRSNVHTWIEIGATLYDLERYALALASYEQALALDPEYPDAWEGKGEVLRELGRDEEADAALQRARELRQSQKA